MSLDDNVACTKFPEDEMSLDEYPWTKMIPG